MQLILEITDEELAAINHVVVDGEAWANHAFLHVGALAVTEKIKKYQERYKEDKEKYGDEYKTRAERMAVKQAVLAEKIATETKAREAQQTEEQARFNAAVAASVEEILKARGL